MQDCIVNRKSPLDRFIPPRPHHCPQLTHTQLPQDSYESMLSREMLAEHPHEQDGMQWMGSVKQLITRRTHHHEKKTTRRNVQLEPEKILDAPEIRDDYYLNLLDWSRNGILAIGLGERVYLYSPQAIQELTQKEDEYVCSLSFHPQGHQLAMGLSSGKVQLYDVERQRLLRVIKSHSNRVSSAAFTYGMLFTGSKDTKIIGNDYREAGGSAMRLIGHRGEVCGLKHDACGLASGSNDNSAMIWDLQTGKARHQLVGHKAAVKALAWCPWQRNLLATGGGTSDQTMRFWNIETGKLMQTVNTESQVCALLWNPKEKEILSSHGFSENQLSLWRYPGCSKVADLHGHSQRVLHMVMAPDNATVCTASADETLRFWRVFEGTTEPDYGKGFTTLNTKFCTLR